jgi:hypothetical protein
MALKALYHTVSPRVEGHLEFTIKGLVFAVWILHKGVGSNVRKRKERVGELHNWEEFSVIVLNPHLLKVPLFGPLKSYLET